MCTCIYLSICIKGYIYIAWYILTGRHKVYMCISVYVYKFIHVQMYGYLECNVYCVYICACIYVYRICICMYAVGEKAFSRAACATQTSAHLTKHHGWVEIEITSRASSYRMRTIWGCC